MIGLIVFDDILYLELEKARFKVRIVLLICFDQNLTGQSVIAMTHKKETVALEKAT